MTKRRIISMILAVCAAVLVIFAGRSCAKNISEANQKLSKINSDLDNNDFAYTGGNVNNNTNQNQQQTTEEESNTDYEVVTNLLGEVVATIPITTAEQEDVPYEENTAPVEENTRITILNGNASEVQPTSPNNSILDRSENNQPEAQEIETEYVAPSDIVIHVN